MTDNYRFEIETTSFQQRMRSLQNSFPIFIKTIMKRLGLRLIAKVKMLTPVDTGLLRRSWFLKEPTATSDEVSIEIKNNTKYAAAVEYGSVFNSGKWTAGRIMLKLGIREINEQAPQILEAEIQRFIDKNVR